MTWDFNPKEIIHQVLDHLKSTTTTYQFHHHNHHHLPITSHPPPSTNYITFTICHYHHHNHHHLSLSSSQPPPFVTIIITTTTICHYISSVHAAALNKFIFQSDELKKAFQMKDLIRAKPQKAATSKPNTKRSQVSTEN